MNYVTKLKKMNLDPESYRFHLELSLGLLRDSLPLVEAAGDALQTFWLEMLAHRERSYLGSAAVKKAELHDLEEDRRDARRVFKSTVEGMRSDISEIENELEFLSRKTQPEQDQSLPGMPSESVDNTTGQNGQKKA